VKVVGQSKQLHYVFGMLAKAFSQPLDGSFSLRCGYISKESTSTGATILKNLDQIPGDGKDGKAEKNLALCMTWKAKFAEEFYGFILPPEPLEETELISEKIRDCAEDQQALKKVVEEQKQEIVALEALANERKKEIAALTARRAGSGIGVWSYTTGAFTANTFLVWNVATVTPAANIMAMGADSKLTIKNKAVIESQSSFQSTTIITDLISPSIEMV